LLIGTSVHPSAPARHPSGKESCHHCVVCITHGRWSVRPGAGVVRGAAYDAAMSDQNASDFPDDLFHARRELHEVHAALRTMQAARPWSVEPSEGWDDSGAWYPSVRPAGTGPVHADRRHPAGAGRAHAGHLVSCAGSPSLDLV
jgi:hypothetical protein